MKKELRDIFPEPEKERTVPEFLEWYKKGIEKAWKDLKIQQNIKNCPTAKRLSEETSALYNLLLAHSAEFNNYIIKLDLHSQPFHVKIECHTDYKFIEIVMVGIENDYKKYQNILGLKDVAPIACEIEKAILAQTKKQYGPNYFLLVSYNNKGMPGDPWKKELFRQLKQKNISHGCFEDIFITGFTMGDSVWKLPKIIEK